MDDLKLSSNSEEKIDTLMRTVYVFDTDIGWSLELQKCGILTMKRQKVVRWEGIKLPNSEVMKAVKNEGYTYLGIVELDKIKENKMKEKNKEAKTSIGQELKLTGKNKICYNSNKSIDMYIQNWSRNTTVEREWN